MVRSDYKNGHNNFAKNGQNLLNMGQKLDLHETQDLPGRGPHDKKCHKINKKKIFFNYVKSVFHEIGCSFRINK